MRVTERLMDMNKLQMTGANMLQKFLSFAICLAVEVLLLKVFKKKKKKFGVESKTYC